MIQTNKASPAGWVIHVMRPATGTVREEAHFDVAIADVLKATEAATRKFSPAGAASGRAVRPLSSNEIKSLGLKIGQVKRS
jgi:hypothetical protein